MLLTKITSEEVDLKLLERNKLNVADKIKILLLHSDLENYN